MKDRYQDWSDVNFLGFFYWCFKWDGVAAEQKKKSLFKTLHPRIASFVFYSVYYDTI